MSTRLNSPAGGVDAFVDDALHALPEAVAGLERGRHRDEDVRQLLLEGLQALPGPLGDDRIGDERAAYEGKGDRPDRRLEDRGDEAGDQARGQHDVGELGGLQGHVGPLQDLVELLPVAQLPEHALRRPEERREEGHLAALPLPLDDLALVARDVRLQAAFQPRTLRRSEREGDREEREEADDAGEDGEAPVARVEEVRQDGGRARWGGRRHSGSRDGLRDGVSTRELDGQLELVAGAGVRHVLELPSAAEILGDRVVDLGQDGRRGSAVIRAASVLGQALKRLRVEPVALDADHVHVDSRLLGGRDGVVQRSFALGLVAISDEDHDPRRERLSRQHVRRQHDRVVHLRSHHRVDRDAPERRIGVDRRRREARQRDNARCIRGHSDSIFRRLCGDKGACGRRSVGERLAEHRLRAVDRDDDALRRAEVRGRETGDGRTVLGQPRGRRGRRGRDDGHADARELSGVDRFDLPGREGGGDEDEGGE